MGGRLTNLSGFNTQPPEGGCSQKANKSHQAVDVSTHSHLKVAASVLGKRQKAERVSTHSHLKVAAVGNLQGFYKFMVSTHSHLKVAAV